jgi:hypothetical protein
MSSSAIPGGFFEKNVRDQGGSGISTKPDEGK